MFCTESIDTMVIISSEHLRSTEVNNIFDRLGSIGNSAIFLPNLVSSPSSSSAPRWYKLSNASISVYISYSFFGIFNLINVYIAIHFYN